MARDTVVVFSGVSRGPQIMLINGRVRPAYEWCEMFGHTLDNGRCTRCGGIEDGAD